MAKLISIGEILDQTFNIYTKNFKSLMSVTAWFFIIALLGIITAIFRPVSEIDFLILQGLLSTVEVSAIVLSGITLLIVTPLVGIWVSIALIIMVSGRDHGKKETLKAINKKTWQQFLSYIWVAFLKALILLIPVLAILPGIILGAIDFFKGGGVWLGAISIIAILVGAMVGLALTVVLSIWLSFPAYALILDKIKGLKALKTSKELVRGRFWPVLLRLLVPKTIFVIALIVVQSAIALILVSAGSLSTFDTDTAIRLGEIIKNLTGFATTALSVPLFIIADYLVYDSLRKTPHNK